MDDQKVLTSVLSTGVLGREPATVSAVTNIVNLGYHEAYDILVEVWDWSSYDQPVKLPVYIGDNVPVTEPYLLETQHLAVLWADVGIHNTLLYEMRFTFPENEFIVINCFGRSVPPYTSQEGNTVFFRELVKICYPKPYFLLNPN